MTSQNDTGRDLWEIQREFTEKFWATKGGMPKSDDLTAVTKDYALHIIREVTEVVDELNWKMHRSSKDEMVDTDNVLEELIDCQKFLLGVMQVWGFTYEQYVEEFKRKSMVVEQRFAQERSFPSLASHPVAIIDIDGVLSDYPRCFYEWVAKWWDNSVAVAKRRYEEMTIVDKEIVKRTYRQSGAKASLPVLPGAVELLKLIRKKGLKVVLLTNRPYADHYRIYPDTLEWLAKNDLEYDGIVWSQDKGFDAVKNFKNVCFAIDDTDKNIQRLREAKIQVIKVDPEDETRDTAAVLRLARVLPKIEDLGWEWNKIKQEITA